MKATKQDRINELLTRLTPDHIFDRTSVLSTDQNIGIQGLTPAIKAAIKAKYIIYYESYIKPEAEELLLGVNKKLSKEMRRALEAIHACGSLERYNGLYWYIAGSPIVTYCKGTDQEFSTPVNSFNHSTIVSLIEREIIEVSKADWNEETTYIKEVKLKT